MPAGNALRKQPLEAALPKERARGRPDERSHERIGKHPKPRLYHARMLVTRLEEWCVEASTPEEARALFAAGAGHRCSPGESIQVEIDQLIDE